MRDEDGGLTDTRRMAAGFMAGVTEAFLIVTPCEVVKIRLQQQTGGAKEALKYKVGVGVCVCVCVYVWVVWMCVVCVFLVCGFVWGSVLNAAAAAAPTPSGAYSPTTPLSNTLTHTHTQTRPHPHTHAGPVPLRRDDRARGGRARAVERRVADRDAQRAQPDVPLLGEKPHGPGALLRVRGA